MRVQRYSKALKRYSADLGTCKNLYRDERSEAPQGAGSSAPVNCSHPSGHGKQLLSK